jgi:uracil-DNA glycosylase family 4
MALELDDRQRAMLQEMGVRVWLPGTEFFPEPAQEAPPSPLARPPAPAVVSQPPASAPVRLSGAEIPVQRPAPTVPALSADAMDWDALATATASCQACGLCAGRKNSTLRAPSTPGQVDWMVVGDPPDEDEDRAGLAFAEAAGVLMDNMLKAIGASRTGTGPAGAYLTNVVKCRPPHSRIPQAAELVQCASYLQREIALVQPKIILAMGRFATQLLLSEQPALATLPLGKLRGTVYRYQGVAVVVTYHPKVLLRASADKAKAWADLCLAMQTIQDQ